MDLACHSKLRASGRLAERQLELDNARQHNARRCETNRTNREFRHAVKMIESRAVDGSLSSLESLMFTDNSTASKAVFSRVNLRVRNRLIWRCTLERSRWKETFPLVWSTSGQAWMVCLVVITTLEQWLAKSRFLLFLCLKVLQSV